MSGVLDRAQQPSVSGPGDATPALEFSYFEQPDPLVFANDYTYAGDEPVGSPVAMEWNHGLAETITAVLNAGLELTSLAEHDSTPWDALPGLMVVDPSTGEYRLRDRPQRLPATFTLTARKPTTT